MQLLTFLALALNESDSEYEGNRHMGFEEEGSDLEEEYDYMGSNALNRPADPEMYDDAAFNVDFGF